MLNIFVHLFLFLDNFWCQLFFFGSLYLLLAYRLFFHLYSFVVLFLFLYVHVVMEHSCRFYQMMRKDHYMIALVSQVYKEMDQDLVHRG